MRICRSPRAGFTLVELLVVIGIIALLISILLPTLGRARAAAKSAQCLSNLRQISTAFVMYNTQNRGYIIPSYNMTALAPPPADNYQGGPSQPLEGWASILDRDRLLQASRAQSPSTVYYCPDTFDIDGMAAGQTAATLGGQQGWTDWPLIFTTAGGDSAPKQAVTYPDKGFNKIIRVGYWINAYNPVGTAVTASDFTATDLYYTNSVGFGNMVAGKPVYLQLHRTSRVRYSSRLITVADGLYMGRQSVNGIGMTNTRIGYRHPGAKGLNKAANAAFADGHAERLDGADFPCGFATTASYTTTNKGSTTYAKQLDNNLHGPTVYSDPEWALKCFLATNPTPQ